MTTNNTNDEFAALPTMGDGSNETWIPFDDEDWSSADELEEAPERRKRISTLSLLCAGNQMSCSNGTQTTTTELSEESAASQQNATEAAFSMMAGCQPSGIISRRSLTGLSMSDHAATVAATVKKRSSKSPTRRSSRSISPKRDNSGGEQTKQAKMQLDRSSSHGARRQSSLSPNRVATKNKSHVVEDSDDEGPDDRRSNNNREVARSKSPLATQSSHKKQQKKGLASSSHHSKKSGHKRSTSSSSNRRELMAKSLSDKEEKPKSQRHLPARTGSDKVARSSSRRQLMAKSLSDKEDKKGKSQRHERRLAAAATSEEPHRSRSNSQRRRNLSMRGERSTNKGGGGGASLERQPSTRIPRSERSGGGAALERQPSTRIPRSERRRVRKSQSLQEGYKLSDEAIERMGLDKVKMSDLGPQLPSASGGGQLKNASERFTSKQLVVPPFRRSKTDAPSTMAAKLQLSKAVAAGGPRLVIGASKRSLITSKGRTKSASEERRSTANGKFQQAYESTVQAFVPKTFISGSADTSSSTLEDKVLRMKELSKSFHRSHNKRLTEAEAVANQMAREVPMLFRTGATSA